MGGFAEYERKVIRARTMRGKRKRAEAGQQPARSRPPFGYHIVTHADITRGEYSADMLGRYVLNTLTAPIAKRIFEWYAAGTHSFGQICKELNRLGIASPGNGKSWHDPTIRLLLTNPVYKGQPLSGRIRRYVDEDRLQLRHRFTGAPLRSTEVRYLAPEDEWLRLSAPAIVSTEVWEAVQERIIRMKEMHRGSTKQLKMLSGMTFCPSCGGRAKIRYQKANGVRYTHLRCSAFDNARHVQIDRPCRGDVYKLEVVEGAVIQAIKEAIQKPEVVRAAIHAYNDGIDEQQFDLPAEIARVDTAIERLRNEEAAAIQAQIAGIRADASPDAYASVFADIAARRKDLANLRGELCRRRDIRETALSQPVGDIVASHAMDETVRILTSDHVTGAEKHDAVMRIVDRVVCLKGGAEIAFVPGLFGENDAAHLYGKSILHTTCMVIQFERGEFRYRKLIRRV